VHIHDLKDGGGGGEQGTGKAVGRRKVRLIEVNAKCCHLEKNNLDFAAGVYQSL
jgi:hypothetical protein